MRLIGLFSIALVWPLSCAGDADDEAASVGGGSGTGAGAPESGAGGAGGAGGEGASSDGAGRDGHSTGGDATGGDATGGGATGGTDGEGAGGAAGAGAAGRESGGEGGAAGHGGAGSDAGAGGSGAEPGWSATPEQRALCESICTKEPLTNGFAGAPTAPCANNEGCAAGHCSFLDYFPGSTDACVNTYTTLLQCLDAAPDSAFECGSQGLIRGDETCEDEVDVMVVVCWG